jgi:hypothetical protein
MGLLQGEPQCLIAELRDKEITHVILGKAGGRGNWNMRAVVDGWPYLFRKQLENDSFTVYRFRPELVTKPRPRTCSE